MKITVSEFVDADEYTVERTIESLSRYAGMNATVHMDYDGCSSIEVRFEREETGPEKSIRIRRERALKVTRQAMEISNKLIASGFLRTGKHAELADIFSGQELTEGQKAMPARVGSFSELNKKAEKFGLLNACAIDQKAQKLSDAIDVESRK